MRQDGLIPVHELMQTTHFGYQVIAGSQIQVVGVGQNQVGVDLGQVSGGQCFDGRLSPNRGENRGQDRSVGGLENPGPGAPRAGLEIELEGGQVALHGQKNPDGYAILRDF